MRFLDIVTGWPGGMTVSRLLKCSGFFKLCEGGQRLNENVRTLSGGVEIREYLVGGIGYPLLPWLITPYERNGLTGSISVFNAAHGAARQVDPLGRTMRDILVKHLLHSKQTAAPK
ncbi:hypothetical protein CerSpe_103750 [Prunus speciosa]